MAYAPSRGFPPPPSHGGARSPGAAARARLALSVDVASPVVQAALVAIREEVTDG